MDINLENDKLFKELEQTKKELSMAHSGYQYASSKDEIDYYIYQIKAMQSKFTHILNKINELEKITNV